MLISILIQSGLLGGKNNYRLDRHLEGKNPALKTHDTILILNMNIDCFWVKFEIRRY